VKRRRKVDRIQQHSRSLIAPDTAGYVHYHAICRASKSIEKGIGSSILKRIFPLLGKWWCLSERRGLSAIWHRRSRTGEIGMALNMLTSERIVKRIVNAPLRQLKSEPRSTHDSFDLKRTLRWMVRCGSRSPSEWRLNRRGTTWRLNGSVRSMKRIEMGWKGKIYEGRAGMGVRVALLGKVL